MYILLIVVYNMRKFWKKLLAIELLFQVRATLKYIQDNQFPAVTVFRDNKPHYYRRDETTGFWQPMRY